MTEFNLFCYAKVYNDKDSFQQKRYRVFNKEITEGEYNKIKIPEIKLEFDKNKSYTTRYQAAFINAWNKLNQEEKDEFLNLPHFDKDIFKEIT